MLRRTLAVAAAVLAVTACSAQQNAQNATASAPPLRNPLDFSLYPGSTLLSTRAFTQVINADTAPGGNSVFDNGNGTYDGHEVIASSAASFSDLSTWVERVNTTPPKGYTAAENGNNPSQRADAERYGLDYAVFTKKTGSRTRGVLLLVMDPRLVNARFATIFGLIQKYRALPAIMRAPIDNAAKARIGMTITQATEPDSPVGAALAALDQFEHKNSRGIVVLDAAKR